MSDRKLLPAPVPKSARTIWHNDDNDDDDFDYADESAAGHHDEVIDRSGSSKRNRRCTASVRLRRIASGLRLAHSQALAVVGFLPADTFDDGQQSFAHESLSTRDLLFGGRSSTMVGGRGGDGVHSNSSSCMDNTTTSSSVLPAARCGGGGDGGMVDGNEGGMIYRLNQRSSFHGRGQTFNQIQ